MSQKEALRAQVMELLTAGKIGQKQAADRLSVSVRQIKRILKRYREAGLKGLISKKRGMPSNRRLTDVLRHQAIEVISTHYRDFGPTLACEKLQERHHLSLSVETTRQLMIEAELWMPRKGARLYTHPMRERRARLGEMIQIDGSPHDWFEGRSEYCTLLVFIDDATGKLMQLRFVSIETTLGYMHILYDHIKEHGIPATLYSDKHSIFRINARDANPSAETQFSRAARELGIECIHANTPQAKGRVERANQTLQDRLVKEMRLAGINSMDEANAWLPVYIQEYNQRFSVAPQDTQDAHLPYQGTEDSLRHILSVHVAKRLSNNLSFQYEGQLIQVQTNGQGLALRQANVTLCQHFDGTQELLWQKRRMAFTVMTKAQKQAAEADSKTVNTRVDIALAQRTRSNMGRKPSANHPWRHTPVSKPTTDGQTVTQLSK
ncbi:ISNCY family transposase [Ferrovum sp. PN-J185]|uniref:ISNCY family transposase n=1 Tax=Ferrovum sp. PN-J185 TaxID=1356306 RepID=UPI0007932ADE|nr:ISNCY family transposase [Ferrovum sp. PN-J185]KXW56425.1 integrase core domain protein [Ferrovum sp. PN-J185]